ncbi:hypothetical protein [Clostridium sp.]|uniref:hypothetical protein n=1 Tax=Clostridium sp. TaxID=1506 RepID=UPI003F2F3EF8
MDLAVQIVQIVFYCVAILFMIILSIIFIWGFVIFNKMHRNQKVNNLLLDKINYSISKLHDSSVSYNSDADTSNVLTSNDEVDLNNLVDNDYNNDTEYSKDNIISF